ncbi:MAG: nuclear transport factor 2 family protein [Rhodospirillaceae bacterium]|nr:nuclear transport factor 2 family protein [Rhodospirillaceae bacterium]
MTNSATPSAELLQLLDKQAIAEVLVRYCRAVDRGDLALLTSCYHDDATEDHGGLFAGSAADYIKSIAAVLTAPRLMTHSVTNILIDVDGDRAQAESHILAFARMRKSGEFFDTLTLARVVDRFERRAGQWRIAARTLAWEWNHEMPMAETWGRGLIAPDPRLLVRGGKKPNDILYQA